MTSARRWQVKILVCIKRVADPDNANKVKISSDGTAVTSEGLEWKVNPFDEYAVEAALRLNENKATKQTLGETVVLTIGPADAAQQVRYCLAMGADRGILIDGDDQSLDATQVVDAIAKVYQEEKPDLVLVGKQVVDGDSNQVPQMLAEKLGLPQATFAARIEVPKGGGEATVHREVDGGIAIEKAKLPAVVSMDLRIVAPEAVKNNETPASEKYEDGPRYASLRGIMQAKKKPIATKSFSDLGIDARPRISYVRFEAPPARQAGIIVPDVATLMAKLRDEAKVI
jgi:electron transfer flavoprotein beta subunit